MMKISACATLLLVAALASVQADGVGETKGNQGQVGLRLGHFRSEPFSDLYKIFAAKFLIRRSFVPPDVYEIFKTMPAGHTCATFFSGFQCIDYKLNDLNKMALLDACLGYLFRNEHKELDTVTEINVKRRLEEDEAGKEVYQKMWKETKIEELDYETKLCISNLLQNFMLAGDKALFGGCSDPILQILLQFAKCQAGKISADQRQGDSYLKIIYESLSSRVRACLFDQVNLIGYAVDLAYAQSKQHRNVLKLKALVSQSAKQELKWPKQLVIILSAVLGTTNHIELEEVRKLIRGVVKNDETFKQRFLENMANYASKAIKQNKDEEAKEDPNGSERYNKLVNSLCKSFRASDQSGDGDFATPMIRLNVLLGYQYMSKMQQDEFVIKMLKWTEGSYPLYLGLQVCDLLSLTEGAIREPSSKTNQRFNVIFKTDITESMFSWPDI